MIIQAISYICRHDKLLMWAICCFPWMLGFGRLKKNQLFLYKTSKISDPPPQVFRREFKDWYIQWGNGFCLACFPSLKSAQRKNINQSAGGHSSDPRTFGIFFWKSDSCGLESEHKNVLTSSVSTLGCVTIDFGVVWPISDWLLDGWTGQDRWLNCA